MFGKFVMAAAVAALLAMPGAAQAQRGFGGGHIGGGHIGGFGGGHIGGFGGGFAGARIGGLGGGFGGARIGGFGGGLHGPAIGGLGGFRAARIGPGFRTGALGFRGPGIRTFGPGFRTFGPRFAFGPRFNRSRFGHRHFFAGPLFLGAYAATGWYGGSCWSWEPTPFGWRRVYVCDSYYGYPYGYPDWY